MGTLPKHQRTKTNEFHPDRPYFIPYADLSPGIRKELDNVIQMRKNAAVGAAAIIGSPADLNAFPAGLRTLRFCSWINRNAISKIQALIASQGDVVANRKAHPNLPAGASIADTHAGGYVAGIEKGLARKGPWFSAEDTGIVLCPNSSLLEKAKRKIATPSDKLGISAWDVAPVRGRFKIDIRPQERPKR
jgi:hypothetical protein